MKQEWCGYVIWQITYDFDLALAQSAKIELQDVDSMNLQGTGLTTVICKPARQIPINLNHVQAVGRMQ